MAAGELCTDGDPPPALWLHMHGACTPHWRPHMMAMQAMQEMQEMQGPMATASTLHEHPLLAQGVHILSLHRAQRRRGKHEVAAYHPMCRQPCGVQVAVALSLMPGLQVPLSLGAPPLSTPPVGSCRGMPVARTLSARPSPTTSRVVPQIASAPRRPRRSPPPEVNASSSCLLVTDEVVFVVI